MKAGHLLQYIMYGDGSLYSFWNSSWLFQIYFFSVSFQYMAKTVYVVLNMFSIRLLKRACITEFICFLSCLSEHLKPLFFFLSQLSATGKRCYQLASRRWPTRRRIQAALPEHLWISSYQKNDKTSNFLVWQPLGCWGQACKQEIRGDNDAMHRRSPMAEAPWPRQISIRHAGGWQHEDVHEDEIAFIDVEDSNLSF